MDLDLAMEKLHLSGLVLATLTLDINAPFPHVTHLSVTFVEKPDIWFSVRILKVWGRLAAPLRAVELRVGSGRPEGQV